MYEQKTHFKVELPPYYTRPNANQKCALQMVPYTNVQCNVNENKHYLVL